MRLTEDYSGATSDAHLVSLWLSGRTEGTRRAYTYDSRRFLNFVAPTNLQEATVSDVVAWAETLTGKPATRARAISSVKSLLSYAHKTGYTVFNIGVALRCPRQPSKLHERIVDEATIKKVIAAATRDRDRTLVQFLYASGARISEVCQLRFLDLGPGNRVTLQGKGDKTRTIIIPETVVASLKALRTKVDLDSTRVFKSLRGRPLGERDARDVVYKVAKAAGVKMSPHFFRHAHGSHALDHGAPIHLVQQSLGHENVATTSRYLHARPNQGSSEFLSVV